ncbi:MAG: uncharacterized protein JWP40_2047 [Blastococcus sp.]|nr:uncharacterized protein [Blastococcus sp.]
MVTAPLAQSPGPGLEAVAAWDIALLRGAVITLGAVAARLPVWRMRLESVGRSLGDAQCWSGPAALSAADAVLGLSVVATAVDASLIGSQTAFEGLLVRAETAQELAVQALAAASEGPADAVEAQERERLTAVMAALVPDAAAPDARGNLLALSALEHAEAARRAARAAGDALERVTVGEGAVPATFWDLSGRVAVVGPALAPGLPARRDPVAVATWWAGLSAVAQLAVIRSDPAAVGALDGVPAWARDRANRMVLARARDDPRTPPYAAFTARVVAARIAAEEAAGRQVQVQLLDLAGDRVVVALGDLDSAGAIALLVPGIGTTPGDDLGHLLQSTSVVADAARAAAPAMTVATVAWLGYRTPSGLPGLATRGAARRGGVALDTALDGLVAARTVTGRPPARTTVLAHSYGTVVVDEAADEPGRLAADAVVLLGSPGMSDDAASLEAPEVYDAAAPGDPISWLGWFGAETWAPSYGATELPGGTWLHHSDYYSPDWPTLAAIGEVVAGRRHPD